MADKGKKPFIPPVSAKNIASAKAAFGVGGSAASPPLKKAEPAKAPLSSPYKEEKKENTVIAPAAATKTVAGKTVPGQKPGAAQPTKEPAAVQPPPAAPEPVVAAKAPAKPLHANSRKPAASDESSSEVSSDEDSDESGSDSDAKPKKIDIGVSLSSIKAAFQQDNKDRQNIKKGYDAEEFKRECKEAASGSSTAEGVIENDPTETAPGVVRNAVNNDLGLDVLNKRNIKDVTSRFEKIGHGEFDENGKDGENDELKALKERSEVSGQKSKWENPQDLGEEKEAKPGIADDIEVAACKARKMKEKFEKKARKEEKKNKTPKPKPRSSVQADHHE